MITLLHGSEELLRAEHVRAARDLLGPAELGELSTTWLDGRKTSVAEVCYHCDVMPFLTPQRLVIVEGLLAQLGRRQQRASQQEEGSSPATAEDLATVLAYLPGMPDTTHLILAEHEQVSARSKVYKLLQELAQEGRAQVVVCEAPVQDELPVWVQQRAREKGASIEPAAAQDLATFIGRNLRLIDVELDKLATYRAGTEGGITSQDVRLLVPYAQEANIFDMVDAIGRRDSATALRLLRELQRDGAAPLYLLSMIVRQFRILIQVSDQMRETRDKYAIGRAIGLHHYPTQKAMQQSRNWRMHDLLAVYDRLLETDLAIKTGKLADDLALDLLVVELSQRQPSS